MCSGSSHFLPTPANCIPCATALGATFDAALLRSVGSFLAREAAGKGSSLLLAPTCNIQRNPLNGRVGCSFEHDIEGSCDLAHTHTLQQAYESFSEDPHLSGIMAASYIAGLQDSGVGGCIKHFGGKLCMRTWLNLADFIHICFARSMLNSRKRHGGPAS